jgi:hypothetical protein
MTRKRDGAASRIAHGAITEWAEPAKTAAPAHQRRGGRTTLWSRLRQASRNTQPFRLASRTRLRGLPA